MPLKLKHQTKVQFLKRWRDRYRDATKLESCRFAHRILKYLSDGDVTLTQMKNAWNMDDTEWAAKSVQLQKKADKWVAVKNAESSADNEAGD